MMVNFDGSPLTDAEITEEWNYRYAERLGVLCEDREPTDEQKRMARDEADLAVFGF